MAYPNYGKTYTRDIQVGDKVISIEIGKFSEQASAAVLARCGETVVHTTVALGRKVDLGYFPLSVEFAEKLYAGGIIKGSRWVKRDGRPTDEAILKARVIDRTMRPLFPDGMTNELQIINTVFSYDKENDPDMIGLVATAVGLQVSGIPFDGPVAGLRVGYRKTDNQFLINPTNTDRETSDLDLIVSGSGDSIVMVEAGANEIPEDIMVEALIKAQEELGKMCATITQIGQDAGREAMVDLIVTDAAAEAKKESLIKAILKDFQAEIVTAIKQEGVLADPDLPALIASISEKINAGVEPEGEDFVTDSAIGSAVHNLMKSEARRMIIVEKVRPDERKPDEIRPIWCEVDVFPRTHGSAMFKRGATQAVTITTLGSPSLGQHVEDMEGEEVRHYMHHYNMPPYASGEAGRFGAPKRREIGHGALAERALLPMIPTQAEFPYTIHVVSEILSSNGSTSQASICGSTMSLMAAGVPIKRPVAGIAMGLMSDGDNYVVLSDIQGLEDHVGDMDFKVAGTTEGITAIQMDIKLKGLTRQILVEALDQAKTGRLFILDKMLSCIKEPRQELSTYAPKVVQVSIPGDRIGELIGPGGKVIKGIIEKTGAEVDVEEDKEQGVGIVNISSSDQEKIDMAKTMITNMMRTVEIGEEFDGPVTRIESFGAFVEYLPEREGLVHVSNMSVDFVNDPHEIVTMGQVVHVRIAEIKEDGKIGLTMLTKEEEAQAKSNAGNKPPFRGGGANGGHSGNRRSGGYSGGRSNGGGYNNSGRSGNRGFSHRRGSNNGQDSENSGGGFRQKYYESQT